MGDEGTRCGMSFDKMLQDPCENSVVAQQSPDAFVKGCHTHPLFPGRALYISVRAQCLISTTSGFVTICFFS